MSRERGSMALQLALMTPVLLLLVVVAVYAGRLESGQARVDDAAHDGARAATLARSPAAALAAARSAALATLGSAPDCRSASVDVDLSGFRPGGSVAVSVRCDIERGDLGLLPIPGTATLTGTSVSAVDLYRVTTP